MELLRAQLANYLDWLESRGLTGTVAAQTMAASSLPEPAPQPESPVPLIVHGTGGGTSAPTTLPLESWKVGFYSSSEMTEEEMTMVTRIALALGLPAEDFRIWADDSLVRVPADVLRSPYLVALGPGSGQTLLELGQAVAMNTLQKARQGSPLLTIPHPRAMLKDPNLKAGAWTALQKLKAQMLN
jgi:hypothetical protein